MKILFLYLSNSLPVKKTISARFVNKLLWGGLFSPPLTFRTVAAVTPLDHEIKLIDERHQKINFNEDCDLVGISFATPGATKAYDIADKFRENGTPVIFGGWHSSVLPQEAKQHADSVVIGEAEESWPRLLQDFKIGKLQSFYENPVDLKTIPEAYKRKTMHKGGFFFEEAQATRGCYLGCKYCSITNSKYNRTHRIKTVEQVIKEISSLPQKIIAFLDPSFTQNLKYTKQLFKAMKELNKKFSCNGNIGILYRDDELLKLAAEAGCIEWAIGFESISQESLNSVDKRANKVEEFKPAVDKIHNYGMAVKGNFMFGMDEDRPDIFDKTIDKVYELDLELAGFSILTPMPGTPLFDKLESENRIFTKDWSKYDMDHIVFQPTHMTPQELLEETNRVKKTIRSSYNRLKRAKNCLKYGLDSFFTTGLQNFFM